MTCDIERLNWNLWTWHCITSHCNDYREKRRSQDVDANEPQALPQWTHWKGCHGQAEVGPWVQGNFVFYMSTRWFSTFFSRKICFKWLCVFTNQFGSSQVTDTFVNVFEKKKIFQGFLVSSDGYMNLQLANTEEFIDGSCTGNLGEVSIASRPQMITNC